jgi:hypothetical protein
MTSFKDLTNKSVAWLGTKPDEKTIHVEFGPMEDDGRSFWVINGAWDGVLYEEEGGGLCVVVDATGACVSPVYIVEIDTTTKVNPVETVEVAA